MKSVWFIVIFNVQLGFIRPEQKCTHELFFRVDIHVKLCSPDFVRPQAAQRAKAPRCRIFVCSKGYLLFRINVLFWASKYPFPQYYPLPNSLQVTVLGRLCFRSSGWTKLSSSIYRCEEASLTVWFVPLVTRWVILSDTNDVAVFSYCNFESCPNNIMVWNKFWNIPDYMDSKKWQDLVLFNPGLNISL